MTILRDELNDSEIGVYLHLNRLAVDEFAGRDDILEDNGGLLASVQDDIVYLALDLDGRTLAAVNVNRLVHVRVLNDLNSLYNMISHT
jgi:hypothetical protein